jgi:hypothetical protein
VRRIAASMIAAAMIITAARTAMAETATPSQEQLSAAFELIDALNVPGFEEQWEGIIAKSPAPSALSDACKLADKVELEKFKPAMKQASQRALAQFYAASFAVSEMREVSDFFRGPLGTKYRTAQAASAIDELNASILKTTDGTKHEYTKEELFGPPPAQDVRELMERDLKKIENRMTADELVQLRAFFGEGFGKKYLEINARSKLAVMTAMMSFVPRIDGVQARLRAEKICP